MLVCTVMVCVVTFFDFEVGCWNLLLICVSVLCDFCGFMIWFLFGGLLILVVLVFVMRVFFCWALCCGGSGSSLLGLFVLIRRIWC